MTSANRAICSLVWSRVSAMKRCTSPTAVDRSVSAASRSDLLSLTTLVSVARRSLNCTIWTLLSRSAPTRSAGFDDVDDVAAAVGEDPPTPTVERVFRSLSPLPERIGGAVDEPAHRGRRHLGLAQIRCQPHQLGFDLVPLDRHCGPFDRYHCAIAMTGPLVAIGRREWT